MALNDAQAHFVNRVIDFANLMDSQYGNITTLNALWNGQTTNYSAGLTDEDIAAVAGLEGVTHAEINEVMYIIGQLEEPG